MQESIVYDYLNGGKTMENHFIQRNTRHNLPVLLALVYIWNTRFTEQQQQQQPLLF